MKRYLVVDLSRNFPERPTEPLVRVTRQLVEQLHMNWSDVHVFARTDQSFLQTSLTDTNWHVVQGGVMDTGRSTMPLLSDLLRSFAAQDAFSHVYIASHSGAVLNPVRTACMAGFTFDTIHFSELFLGVAGAIANAKHSGPAKLPAMTMANGFGSASNDSDDSDLNQVKLDLVERPSDAPWRYGHIATLEYSLQVLVEMLRQRGAINESSALKQTQIRRAMAVVDSRFVGSAASTSSHGMIQTLISAARSRGVIQVDHSDLDNSKIWLTCHQGNQPSSTSAAPQPPPKTQRPAQNAQELRESRQRRLSDMARTSRSHEFQFVLEKAGLGVYPIGRPEFFRAITKVLTELKEELTVPQLFERAEPFARELVNERLAKKGSARPVAWRNMRKLLPRYPMEAGVFLTSNGQPISTGFVGLTQSVTNLAADWVLKSEAMILKHLIELMPDKIAEDDCGELALMMYENDASEFRMQIARAMEYLLREGLIEYGPSKTLRPKNSSPPTPTP